MPLAQKVRCENCPARNRHVTTIKVVKTGQQLTLCVKCRTALEKVLREGAND